MRCAYSLALLSVLAPVLLTTASMARAPAWAPPMASPEAGPQGLPEGEGPRPAFDSAGPQPLSDEELSGLRGGFVTTGGFTFGFGVVIRSYIDNKLALQTQLTWTPTGPVTEQVRGDIPGATDLASAVTTLINNGINLSAITGVPASSGGAGAAGGAGGAAGTGDAGDTGGAGGAGGTGGAGSTGSPTGSAGGSIGAGDMGGVGGTGAAGNAGSAGNTGSTGSPTGSAGGSVGAGGMGAAVGVGAGTAGNTGATGAAGNANNTSNTSSPAAGIIGGVALVDGNGATALIHNVTAGQLQSLIVNNANNRNLRQDMELNLYLPDLATMQASSSMQQRASQLTYDLNTSLVGALGR